MLFRSQEQRGGRGRTKPAPVRDNTKPKPRSDRAQSKPVHIAGKPRDDEKKPYNASDKPQNGSGKRKPSGNAANRRNPLANKPAKPRTRK